MNTIYSKGRKTATKLSRCSGIFTIGVMLFLLLGNAFESKASSEQLNGGIPPVFDVPPTPPPNSFICVPTGTVYTTPIQAQSLNPGIDISITNASVFPPTSAIFSPVLPTFPSSTASTILAWLPTPSEWGAHLFNITAEDHLGNITTHSFTLIANTTPVFTSSPPLSVSVNQAFAYNIVVDDPDMPFGDNVSIFSPVHPPWLTIVPTGAGTALLQGTPGPGDFGVYSIVLVAFDTYNNCGPAVEQVFNLEVLPCNLTATVSAPPIECYNGTTCITVSGSGGAPPYTDEGTFCGYSAGTYTFEISDINGCTASATIVVDEPSKLNVSAIATPASCSNNDGSASATANGGSGTYSFLWQPGGATTPTINGVAAGMYVVKVTDGNGCTATATAQVNTTGIVPAMPSPVSGPVGLCKGQSGIVYCVTPDPNALSYEWTLPYGLTGTSNGPCITLSVGSKFKGGYICVKAVNDCGESMTSCLTLNYIEKKPAKPSKIYGPTSVCGPTVVNYCIDPLPNAFGYVWTITGSSSSPLSIISGQGTTCISVNVPAGYTGGQKVKARATNCKGLGDEKSLDVKKTPGPPTPASISGPTAACKSTTQTYSCALVSGVTTYLWAVNKNAFIISGQGTNTIVVNFAMSIGSPVEVAVVSYNDCGMSLPRTLNVAVNFFCKEAPSVAQTPAQSTSEIKAYPNPAHEKVTVAFNLTNEERVRIQLMDMMGRILISEEMAAPAGNQEKALDLEGLAKGVYSLVILTNDNRLGTQLIVVE